MNRYAAIACLLLVTVACGEQPADPPAQTSAPAATAPDAAAPGTAPPSAQNATPQSPEDIEAGEQVEGAEEEEDTPIEQRANIQLAQAIAPPAAQCSSKWKQGTNYQLLVPAQPTTTGGDRIEVMEIFWYGCNHCYALEPFVANWESKKRSANVQFVRTPVMWGPVHRAHARLFFILEAMGKLPELHGVVFREIQENRNMLVTGDPAETERLQINFLERHGVAEADYMKAARSMVVDTKLRRAEEITRRMYDGRGGVVDAGGQRRDWGVPLVVINGKYAADVGSADGQNELFTLVNDLVACESR